MRVLFVVGLALWIIAIGLALVAHLPEQVHNAYVNHMAKYLFAQLRQLYFCSYSLLDVYLLEFFPRYRHFVDWGFCGPIAGMSMLALKHNRTARYIFAEAGKERYRHCWVEFRYFGMWWVIDVCWQFPFVRQRREYYRENSPKILRVCSHQEFWSYPISNDFYKKMLRPKTSWLLCELLYVYNFREDDSNEIFDPEIATATLPEETGYRVNPWLYYRFPEIIFSRRIMHEMMQHPQRKRPTAHRIRKVKKYQRKVKAWYDNYFLEHSEETA